MVICSIDFVLQICNLTDADIATKLIRPEWPEALQVLLLNTLRVNPQERWTAKQAAYYIFTNWIMSKCMHSKEQDLWSLLKMGQRERSRQFMVKKKIYRAC